MQSYITCNMCCVSYSSVVRGRRDGSQHITRRPLQFKIMYPFIHSRLARTVHMNRMVMLQHSIENPIAYAYSLLLHKLQSQISMMQPSDEYQGPSTISWSQPMIVVLNGSNYDACNTLQRYQDIMIKLGRNDDLLLSNAFKFKRNISTQDNLFNGITHLPQK